jgi:Heterokaryon incompatibility protein (HET)
LIGDDLEHIAQTKLEEQTSTGSKENLQLASSWLHNCINNHPQCRPTFEDENWLPTRLIYLGVLDSPVLRIVSTSSLPHRVPYATLSHRWGRTTSYILTSKLLPTYETEIPISDVSATLRDAFHATRSIGLEYLWVDSMCIVQDDPDDWSRESATMSKVYGLSTCTIAAAVGGHGDNVCFADRNQYKVRPCVVPNPFSKESTLSFYVRSQYLSQIYKREVKDSAWYNRGWVFQERTLSPRLLIFGKTQMLWACSKLQAAETWPCGKTSGDFIDRFESFEVEKSLLQTLLDKERVISPFDKTWSTFILDYTRSNLTRMSDRLIALQGLASRIETDTGRRYCAGFWIDSTLPSSLLWSAGSAKLPRCGEYRAPTWSWASIDAQIVFGFKNEDHVEIEVLIEVLGTITLPFHQQHISKVPLAGLRISGSIIPATLIPPSGSDPGELIKRPCLPLNKIQDTLWWIQKRVRIVQTASILLGGLNDVANKSRFNVGGRR